MDRDRELRMDSREELETRAARLLEEARRKLRELQLRLGPAPPDPHPSGDPEPPREEQRDG